MTAYKLNVVADLVGRVCVSPRKVLEEAGQVGKYTLLVTECWLWCKEAGEPVKYRAGAALVAYDGEVAFEVYNNRRQIKDKRGRFLRSATTRVANHGERWLEEVRASLWEAQWVIDSHKESYYPVFQRSEQAVPEPELYF